MASDYWSRSSKAATSRVTPVAPLVLEQLPELYILPPEIGPLSPEEASLFWRDHFRKHKKSPPLLVDPSWLHADIAAGGFGLRLADKGKTIGTVWARPGGEFYLTTEPSIRVKSVYSDGLCLCPEVRGKGHIQKLLEGILTTTVQRFGPEIRCLFLKEGRHVPAKALASDIYLYRRIHDHQRPRPLEEPIPLNKAKQIFNKLSKLYKEPWLINDPAPHSLLRTQFYTDPTESCLLAITETHQHHLLDGRRLGLITGWIADQVLRSDTQALLQQYLLVRQPYTWIWSPSSYIIDHKEWLYDGLMSWYPYQWGPKEKVPMERIFFIL
jgi:hypothetical protein